VDALWILHPPTLDDLFVQPSSSSSSTDQSSVPPSFWFVIATHIGSLLSSHRIPIAEAQRLYNTFRSLPGLGGHPLVKALRETITQLSHKPSTKPIATVKQ
jgi:predicted component of type VI protein secretion system